MPLISHLTTHKELARTTTITCSRCQTRQAYILSRHRTWLTVLRVPLLPRATRYSYHCPHCHNSHPLVKQQIRAMLRRADTTHQ